MGLPPGGATQWSIDIRLRVWWVEPTSCLIFVSLEMTLNERISVLRM